MMAISPGRKQTILVALVIVAVGVFYLTTIREGHDWGGDFSMYIQHAKNIAEGNDYENTGYIFNPFYAAVGPRTYPPIFPLLLLPVYSWFGLNLTAMKVLVILFFLGSLWMLFLTFRHELPFPYVLGIMTVVASNPFFWNFKDEVRPDTPFLFFTYVSLFLINRVNASDQSVKYQKVYAVLLGVAMYLSYGTRSIGIVLIASLVIYDAIRYKKLSKSTIIAVLVCISLIILQNMFLHNDSTYVESFRVRAYSAGVENVYLYAKDLSFFWDNGYSMDITNLLFIGMSLFMIIGYVSRIRRKVTIFEVFPVVYAIFIMLWPGHMYMRGLIPVIPLYVFYCFVGIKYVSEILLKEDWKPLMVGVCVSVIAISYVGVFTKTDFGPIKDGITKRESTELFEFVRNRTDKNDVMIFKKPRILSLFTGRRASVYHRVRDGGEGLGGELLRYFVEIDAKYLIVGTGGGVFERDGVFLRDFVKEYEDEFEMVYSNVDFEVYRFNGQGQELRKVGRRTVGSSG